MNVPSKSLPAAGLVLGLALLLGGCDTRASRSAAAFNRYQAATAAGDVAATRLALLELVAANEDVPAYWTELGKLQYQLKDYNGAFYSFTRASELNRSDPDILRFLTQITLQSGDLAGAEQRAKELDLVAPGDPLVKITTGLIALRRRNFDEASHQADLILASAPLDSDAKILKARALVGLGQRPAAATLLEQQIAAQPNTPGVIRALINLHRSVGEWQPIVGLGQKYLALAPNDQPLALLTIEAAFRTGDMATGRAVSTALLKGGGRPDPTDAVLDLWRERWPGPAPLALAGQLARDAGPSQRVSFARYLTLSGQPQAAVGLVADQAQGTPSPANIDARAAYYGALARVGRQQEARAALEQILLADSGNAIALEALAPLLLALGEKGEALDVARKLVTVEPTSPDARLVLAHSFAGAGDRAGALRTLWDGFHDIPAEERLYTSLRGYLGSDSDAVRRLDSEYADQQERKMTQDLI